jgi:hypothetical protein
MKPRVRIKKNLTTGHTEKAKISERKSVLVRVLPGFRQEFGQRVRFFFGHRP